MEYDVVIVGGGPAVSSGNPTQTARREYGNEISVCLLEKASVRSAPTSLALVMCSSRERWTNYLPDWRNDADAPYRPK